MEPVKGAAKPLVLRTKNVLLISQLRHEYMPPVRANIVDPRTAEIGREMKAQQEKLQVRQEAKRRRESRIRNMARSLRLNPAAVVNARGLEHLKKGLSDD